MSREQAYAWVQRAAMRSHDERLDFKALLAGDREVMAVLSGADLDAAFDLERQLRHAGPIVDRVLGGVASESLRRRTKSRRDPAETETPQGKGVEA